MAAQTVKLQLCSGRLRYKNPNLYPAALKRSNSIEFRAFLMVEFILRKCPFFMISISSTLRSSFVQQQPAHSSAPSPAHDGPGHV